MQIAIIYKSWCSIFLLGKHRCVFDQNTLYSTQACTILLSGKKRGGGNMIGSRDKVEIRLFEVQIGVLFVVGNRTCENKNVAAIMGVVLNVGVGPCIT